MSRKHPCQTAAWWLIPTLVGIIFIGAIVHTDVRSLFRSATSQFGVNHGYSRPRKLVIASDLQLSPDEDNIVTSPAPENEVAQLEIVQVAENTTFLEALSTCETLDCVREAHAQHRDGARFNFPHFFIIGWQKSATTSVYVHFLRHRDVAKPEEKEPEFFSDTCHFQISKCTPERTKYYIENTLGLKAFLKSNGSMCHFEASTHYVRGADQLASDLYKTFPYLKIIMLLREPISRAMSMLIHKKDASKSGCLMERSMAECLLEDSQISGDPDFPLATNYSFPLATWLSSFPAGQVQVMQYEQLIENPDTSEAMLAKLKGFVGLDPSYPRANTELPVRNMRKDAIGSEGWIMEKKQYERLVEMVRPDAREVAKVVSQYGFGDEASWVAAWEAVWKENLDSCKNDTCTIIVS